ncbi:MAG: hypothetical protein OXI43_13450 [Candidatus Poribacteria bacterium]|nr:hypothetical protein [Candidatus Poribacteria bacterium]
MLFLRYCFTIFIGMMLLSIIPLDISACYKLPVVSPETYKAAEKELDKAKESLDKAQKAYDTLSKDYNKGKFAPFILNFFDGLKYRGTSMNSEQAPDRAVHEATQGIRDLQNVHANTKRRLEMEAAENALNAAQAAYDAALKKFNSYQPETRHIKLTLGCGNPDHAVIVCQFNDPLYWSQAERSSYLFRHNKLQASCTIGKIVNGKRVKCTVTGFYFCQNHTCVHPAPDESGSGSSRDRYAP